MKWHEECANCGSAQPDHPVLPGLNHPGCEEFEAFQFSPAIIEKVDKIFRDNEVNAAFLLQGLDRRISELEAGLRGAEPMKVEWSKPGPNNPPECVLVECHDYDAGDPSLEIVARSDGKYDFVIYAGTKDLTVPALSAKKVREAAQRILALVPEVWITDPVDGVLRRAKYDPGT